MVLEPGSDAVAAVLAAGCVTLPLEASAPNGYLADLLADARPVITRGRTSGAAGPPCWTSTRRPFRGSHRSASSHGLAAGAQDAAYAVFTSGSGWPLPRQRESAGSRRAAFQGAALSV